jgi:aspartate/methionine/tyrosine aminotransferase
MSQTFQQLSTDELQAQLSDLRAQADAIRARGLALTMARGNPSPEQLELSKPLLDVLSSSSDLVTEGIDAGNYGAPDGLPAARRLMADILGVDPANLVVGGSSSLEIMNDVLNHCWIHGVCGHTPWSQQGTVKFLCPCPGYDRHFRATEYLGMVNVAIDMTPTGPDMDQVRELVENDPQVKGIWIVPKYANPTGVTLSDDTVRALARLRPAAPDFRIFYDNAYVVHDLSDEPDELLNIFDALAEADAPSLVYEFASTAKVTFPGSGIACVTASPADMADLRASIAVQRVCANKLVQLAHVRFLPDAAAVRAHMARHAAVVRPRFELVERKLSEGLGDTGLATWTHPRGGYFVCFYGPEGSAKAIVALCAELGVTLTPAGAPFPGGNDPHDAVIRIAPTFPSLEDLGAACDVLVLATRIVAAEQELARRA